MGAVSDKAVVAGLAVGLRSVWVHQSVCLPAGAHLNVLQPGAGREGHRQHQAAHRAKLPAAEDGHLAAAKVGDLSTACSTSRLLLPCHAVSYLMSAMAFASGKRWTDSRC